MLRVITVMLLLCCSSSCADVAVNETRLRVMSFNLWHGGDAGGQPLKQSAAVIRAAKADIVGLQETHGYEVAGVRPDNGKKLARILGWYYLDQGGRRGILSRFPIVKTTPGKWGAEVQLPDGRKLIFFNAHLPASPYQPYQLLDIPYGDAPFIRTEAKAIEWARRSRGDQFDRLKQEISPYLQQDVAVVVTGDFNEPSFQDWTPDAVNKGLCPVAVRWPATALLDEMMIRDAYRIAHPDEATSRGLTWTPTTEESDPADRHDRIDFVFVRSEHATVEACEVVGEAVAVSDVVIRPWPSDHRAVVATIVLGARGDDQ